ncbi:PX domain protein [Cooperia oncophora]
MYDDSDESSDDNRPSGHSSGRKRLPFDPKPHLVTIVKTNTAKGGQLRSLNGQLYAPLQHVSAVLADGAAERANLRRGDRILQKWCQCGRRHSSALLVDLIKHGGDRLTMIVISVEDPKFECGEESVISYRHDYSESRSLPVTIPSYHTVNDGVEKFVVFNLYMAGRHLGSRRYSEFVELHSLLRREFVDFSFPKLPGKWPFSLSEQQLDSRRRGLEYYLERVCSVKVIADSDIMQDFLMECDPSCEVEVRVLLPDGGNVCVSIRRNSTTSLLFALLARKLNMSRDMALSCAIFETMEQSFGAFVLCIISVCSLFFSA